MSTSRKSRGAMGLLGALLATQVLAQQTEPAPAPSQLELARELALAVDLPTPKARREAAKRLAARKEIALESWLAAAQSFGNFARDEVGSRVLEAELQVLDAIEATELQVFVPRSYDPEKPHPLLMAFHGTGGSGRGMERNWVATAEALGMLVVAPSEAGANEGYAFHPRERAAAHAALRWARRRWNIDEDRVYLSGISRGGHLAWDLALRSPDRFAAIAPLIGGPRLHALEGQNNLRFVEQLVHLPIRDLQGAEDDPGLLFNLRLAFAKLAAAKARDARLLEFRGVGHGFDFTAVDWTEFLGAARRDPRPASVVRLAVRTDEARAFFLELTRLTKDAQEDIRPKVEAARWNAMSNDEKKGFLQEQADRATARLLVRRAAPDLYAVEEERHVASFRLLLADGLFAPEAPLRVKWRGKETKKTPKREARVLLEDFVERFDRRYLPVVEIRCGG
ncbi:MAG: hypothetical protein JNM84_12250 [Planctomycetes bacterium]|nr:hypothetical protein [Planctomycetota bacterium]